MWAATLTAFALAMLVLVAVVLPAELAIDPLGTGRALGLLGLSRAGAVVNETRPFVSESRTFVLSPFESVEYKYRLPGGSSLLYSWGATGPVLFDLHAQPEGAPAQDAESFHRGRGDGANGTYTAPFDGIHGWFWENRGRDEVRLVLDAVGFTDEAIEFRDGRELAHRLTEPEG